MQKESSPASTPVRILKRSKPSDTVTIVKLRKPNPNFKSMGRQNVRPAASVSRNKKISAESSFEELPVSKRRTSSSEDKIENDETSVPLHAHAIPKDQQQQQQQQQQEQCGKLPEDEMKLPKLKIKLTRSSCSDGSTWSKDTFVVTKGPDLDDAPDGDSSEQTNESYSPSKHRKSEPIIGVGNKQQKAEIENRTSSSIANSLTESKSKRKCAGLKYAKMFDENYTKPSTHASHKRALFSRADEGNLCHCFQI